MSFYINFLIFFGWQNIGGLPPPPSPCSYDHVIKWAGDDLVGTLRELHTLFVSAVHSINNPSRPRTI